MASLYPAMKGKIGTTEYYVTTMKAKDVADKLAIPKSLPGWDDAGLTELFRKNIDYSRVKNHIAPYLANDEDRFFGPLIVSLLNADALKFESVADFMSMDGVPGPYKTASSALGYLVLTGAEMMVPIDGQHRLAAIQFALSGKDEKQQDIAHIVPNAAHANDDVPLMLIKHEPEMSKKIFENANPRARAKGRAQPA